MRHIGFLIILFSFSCKGPQHMIDHLTVTPSKNYVTTFHQGPCHEIKLEYYTHQADHHPHKKADINRDKTIEKIFALMMILPDEGEKSLKPGNVPKLKVILVYAHKTEFFEFYDHSLKTPSTRFYAEPISQEKELFDLLMSQLR